MIVSLPTVIAAVLYTYAEKKALSEQTKQYAAMKILFDKARGRLRDLVDSGKYDVNHGFSSRNWGRRHWKKMATG